MGYKNLGIPPGIVPGHFAIHLQIQWLAFLQSPQVPPV